MRTIRFLLIAIPCAVLLGCKSSEMLWSAESRSPDNHWLAVADTKVNGRGFGTDAVQTVVEIRRTTDSSKSSSQQVLGFMDDGRSLSLQMKWTTPSNLEVSFSSADPDVLFYQVVKTSGVTISVRNTHSAKTLFSRRGSAMKDRIVAATEEDVKSGKAIFFIKDHRSRPYDIGRELPAPGTIKRDMEIPDDGKVIPAGTPITIVQAEVGDTGDVLIGFEYAEGQGLCQLDEIVVGK